MTTQSPAAYTPGSPVRIRRSTAIAPLAPRVAPALTARLVSGRTPTTTSTRSACRVTGSPALVTASTWSRPAAPGAAFADGVDGGAGEDLDAAGGELGVDEGAELRVDGGQHLGQLLDLGDGQAPGGQRVGHLQADVPGADDDRAGRGLSRSGCS